MIATVDSYDGGGVTVLVSNTWIGSDDFFIADNAYLDILEDEEENHIYFTGKCVKVDRILKSLTTNRIYFQPKRKMKAKGIFKKGRCHG